MSGADPRSYTAVLDPNRAFFVSTYFKQLNLHPSSQDTIGRASRHPSIMDEVRSVLGNDLGLSSFFPDRLHVLDRDPRPDAVFAPHTEVTAFYLEQPIDLWGACKLYRWFVEAG
jgi:hypothetical protein